MKLCGKHGEFTQIRCPRCPYSLDRKAVVVDGSTVGFSFSVLGREDRFAYGLAPRKNDDQRKSA